MSAWGAVLGVASALAINEFSDVCPCAAKAVVRWSAGLRYADPERRAIRAEELESLIEERPGQLFKLITALCFATAAIWAWTRRMAESLQVVEAQPGAAGTVALARTLTVTAAAATAVALAA